MPYDPTAPYSTPAPSANPSPVGGPITGGSSGPANYGPANQAGPGGVPTGPVSIWNIPKVLQNLGTAKLWFDNGDKTVTKSTGQDSGENGGGGAYTVHEKEPLWYKPNDIYNYVYGLAAEADVRDSKGNPTPAASAALSKFVAIQQALAGGSYGTLKVSGSFDLATQKALGQALVQYHQESTQGRAQPFTEWLTEQAQKQRELDKILHPQTGTQPRLMDPDQIKMAAQNAAQQALGMGLTADQLNAFVTQFQNEQSTKQMSASGDLYSQSTKLSGEAAAYAQKVDPQAYQANQKQSYMDALVNLFSGPGATARPNITPTPSITGNAPQPVAGTQ